MRKINQTSLNQTGVARVLYKNGKEDIIPLFSSDIAAEACRIMTWDDVNRILDVYAYNVISTEFTDKVKKQAYRGKLDKFSMECLRSGIMFTTNKGYPSDLSCYV